MVTILICVFAILVGLALLLWSGYIRPEHLRALVRELGAVCLASGFITAAWDFAAKRSFAEEVLTRLHVQEQLNSAGIRDVTTDFAGLSWEEFFGSSRQMDFFFARGSSWLFTNNERLRTAMRDRRVRIRVVLPDVTDTGVVDELARRWSEPNARVIEDIAAAESKLQGLAQEHGAIAHVELWRLRRSPLYTYYRFDNVAVFATYNHSLIQRPVPAFVCRRPGSLFNLLELDFDELTQGTRMVQPPGRAPAQKPISTLAFSLR